MQRVAVGRHTRRFAAKPSTTSRRWPGASFCQVSRAGGQCDSHAPWLWRIRGCGDVIPSGRHCCRGRASACCFWSRRNAVLDFLHQRRRSRPWSTRGATTVDQASLRTFLGCTASATGRCVRGPDRDTGTRDRASRPVLDAKSPGTPDQHHDGALRRKPKPCATPSRRASSTSRTILSACADLVPSAHGNR